jgi:hypothetical protein
MGSQKNYSPSLRGMSPLISSVILVAVVLTSTFIVISQLMPSMKSMRDSGAIDSGKQALNSFDKTIQELLYEAPGSKRTLVFKTDGGNFRVSGNEDLLRFSVSMDYKNAEPGSITKEGRMIITYGPPIKAYESDIDSDGQADLVIENDALLFAVRKLNNRTNQGFINLTNSTKPFITAMKNKRLGINITPVLGIYINDIDSTSYGQGYTELVEGGNYLEEGAIRLYLNSSAGLVYEAFFRLLPGADFIQAEVKLR